MASKNNTSQTKSFFSFSQVILLAGFIESLIAAAILLTLPSEGGGFLGLSTARLAILTGILVPGFACLFLALMYRRSIVKPLTTVFIEKEPVLCSAGLIVLSALFLLVPVLLQDLYSGTGIYSYLAYSHRLWPLLGYISLLFLQAAIWIIKSNFLQLKKIFEAEKRFLFLWALTIAGLLVLTAIIAVSRLGLTPDPIGWGAPTVPLMEWQIWLGILLLVIFRVAGNTPPVQSLLTWKEKHPALSNILVSLIIWSMAFGLWSSLPIPPGFFATPPRAPNYEIYPFSDAAYYDFHAQTLIIGLGYRGESIPPRPLYILFLALAHLVAGQEYQKVIMLQTGLLAFLPLTVYWIGRKISNSSIGLVTALFIIFREWTSILCTPFTSDVSNSKLLFADLPAALAISLLLLVAILWLQQPDGFRRALITGGLLGISLLVRTQIIILLPVLLVFLSVVSIRKKISIRSLILPTALFLFGLILAMAPWLSRSYRITGQFVYDHPESQTRLMVLRYFPEIEPSNFDRQPGESTGVYNQRLSADVRQKILTDPGDLAHFVTAHWLNNEIGNLQILPIRFSITSPWELLWPQHPFWEDWKGSADPLQTSLLLINLAVIAAGAVFLTRRNSWIGLLPVTVNLAYHFSNAAARNSGWRYLLPVDWIFLLYFSAGIYALVNFGRTNLSGISQQFEIPNKQIPLKNLAALAAGILCIGILPLVAERSFPKIYPSAKYESTGQRLLEAAGNLPVADGTGLKSLVSDPNVILMHGRMLYPRFYEAKDGEEKTGKTGYAPLPYARYVFLVAGDPEGTVIFPNKTGDLPLRNAQDVILAGCMDGLAVKARVVLLPDSGQVFSASPSSEWVCPNQP